MDYRSLYRNVPVGAFAKIVLVTACLVMALSGYGCTAQPEFDSLNSSANSPKTMVAPSESEGSADNAADESFLQKSKTPANEAVEISAFDAQFQHLFETRANDVQVTGAGTVTKLLADDVDGDKHQRFILTLGSGQTLLIVHNIDIAPRIETLRKGDTVEFCGEYVYNDQGGLVHWTHHDPNGRHAPGYIIVNGQTYS